MFTRLWEYAKSLGIAQILEGTNEDDLHVYRPGLQAVRELGIKSPLAEAGFTKEEVRRLARELGISVAERPSAPCLATRLPYGEEIRMEVLEKIAQGEEYLKAADALCYYRIVDTVLGKEWLNKDLFRFGVSRVANSILSAVEQKTVSFF